jgi:hypothetical protein
MLPYRWGVPQARIDVAAIAWQLTAGARASACYVMRIMRDAHSVIPAKAGIQAHGLIIDSGDA